MSKFGTLLRAIRLRRGEDLATMADTLSAAAGQLALVEAGVAPVPPAVDRRRWAKLLGFTDLLDLDRQWRDRWPRLAAPHPRGWIPIINAAPAGPPVDYEEFGIDSGVGYDYVPRANTPEQQNAAILFAVLLVGDSMTPQWNEGDLVIFRPLAPDEPVPDGSAVFVRLAAARDHACTFKRVWRRSNGMLELRPDNPAYSSLLIPTEDVERMAFALECRRGFGRSSSGRHAHETLQPFHDDLTDH